ncbi:uncharacterized protein LOC124917338 [Impatiens glandulifera]|uniref:uncharacterized protein LOC124917338 n=1 Tax=Impatiens glandulifera TaxID=253017 RepID=UPI001FB0E588|nr:uncharacterized protein LOC124917338 [Impatiens glandulifera]
MSLIYTLVVTSLLVVVVNVWRLLDWETKDVFMSHDVVFYENEFPFALVDCPVSVPPISVVKEAPNQVLVGEFMVFDEPERALGEEADAHDSESEFSVEQPQSSVKQPQLGRCVEPKSYRHAFCDPGWRAAMQSEIRALEDNRTWSLEDLPQGKKTLGSRWVYKIKHNSDGSIERLKARLMDVHNAFLHGDLIEEVYMRLPPGFEFGHTNKSRSDHSLFSFVSSDAVLHFLIYVDDMIVSGSDLGTLKKYVLYIIFECGFLGTKPAGFPMEQNHKLGESMSAQMEDQESYRRITIRQHCGFEISEECLMTRSVTRWFVFLGSSLVSWKSKKQPTVALSSAEAEYRSLTTLICELKWLQGVMVFLGVPQSGMHVYSDSQSTLHMAQNPMFYERSKHIEVNLYFLRDHIQDETIVVSHVPTTSQLTNILTKPLGKQLFDHFRSKLGICGLHVPT